MEQTGLQMQIFKNEFYQSQTFSTASLTPRVPGLLDGTTSNMDFLGGKIMSPEFNFPAVGNTLSSSKRFLVQGVSSCSGNASEDRGSQTFSHQGPLN